MRLSAHWWTIERIFRYRLHGLPEVPVEQPWSTEVIDPDLGPLKLSGRLAVPAGADAVAVLIHGLGGSIESGYLRRAAAAAHRLGMASLRLNLRGADRLGADLHHAGQSDDLEAVVQSAALADFRHIVFLGFSLGGHITLRFATHVADPRVRAVAAVCSPVELNISTHDFDRPSTWVYRRYILSGLFELMDSLGEHPLLQVDREALRRVRTIRAFDSLTVVPRFGFRDADDYYDCSSVCRRFDALRVPSFLLAAEGDPMVTARSIRAGLIRAPDALRVQWTERGGHVGFPPRLDLGQEAPLGAESQMLGWLASHC